MATKELRINGRIRISPIRLIGPDGTQLGIIPTEDAIQKARDYDLDLVEVSPNSRPPVCRILDYGKYKYELAKKEKTAKKKQHSYQLKEMRYRPKIDEHDFQFKTKHVREFLEHGSKVRCFVMFRGREMAHTEYGRKVLDRVYEELKDMIVLEMRPKMEGRNMSMVISPSPDYMKALKKRQAAKDAEQKRPAQEVLEAATEETSVNDTEKIETEDKG